MSFRLPRQIMPGLSVHHYLCPIFHTQYSDILQDFIPPSISWSPCWSLCHWTPLKNPPYHSIFLHPNSGNYIEKIKRELANAQPSPCFTYCSAANSNSSRMPYRSKFCGRIMNTNCLVSNPYSLQNLTFRWPCIMQWFLANFQLDAQILFNVFIYL